MTSQEWYSRSLDRLQPLRFHMKELIDAIEEHNRLVKRLNQLRKRGEPKDLPVRTDKLKKAKRAADRAERFFSPAFKQ